MAERDPRLKATIRLKTTMDHYADECARLRARVEKLEGLLKAITGEFEGAVRAVESRGKGGQHVPYHGDFGSAPPSIINRMRWWAKEFRAALRREEG